MIYHNLVQNIERQKNTIFVGKFMHTLLRK